MKLKFGSLICILILCYSLLFADDIYFSKNRLVWENCKIVNTGNKKVSILFIEKHGEVTVEKHISSIFGVVSAPVDPTGTSRIRAYSWDDLKGHIEQKDIHSIFHACPGEVRMESDLMAKLGSYLENDYVESPVNINDDFAGLGLHARNELEYLYNYQGVMSNEERTMHYCSKLRRPVPAVFSNFLGIASIAQKDYEFGFIIMACEIGGLFVLANSHNNAQMKGLGFTLLDLGFIMSIVRPLDFADRYNKALLTGLQFDQGI